MPQRGSPVKRRAAPAARRPTAIRYRLRHIKQLIGESLDDPNSRLALELGIRLLDRQRRAEVAPRRAATPSWP